MASDIQPEGYNEEERYFREKEIELLRKKKEAKGAATPPQNPHFMKCPKCGNDLTEIEIEKVKVDRCTNCQGIFLDKGELEQLAGDRDTGFFASLRKMF